MIWMFQLRPCAKAPEKFTRKFLADRAYKFSRFSKLFSSFREKFQRQISRSKQGLGKSYVFQPSISSQNNIINLALGTYQCFRKLLGQEMYLKMFVTGRSYILCQKFTRKVVQILAKQLTAISVTERAFSKADGFCSRHNSKHDDTDQQWQYINNLQNIANDVDLYLLAAVSQVSADNERNMLFAEGTNFISAKMY